MADRKPWEEFSNTTSSDAPAEQKPWEAFGGETKPEPKGFLGHARDLGLSAVKSAIAVPETVVGLADIPTGGRVGKFLENEGGAVGFRPKQAKEFVSEFHTDQYKDQQRQFQEADGILDKTAVAIKNPSLIANTVTESVAPMLAGGVAARGLMAGTRLGQMGAKGAAAAGAIGEGTMMAGSQASAIRQETDDGLLTPTQAGAAVATGLAGTLFGYLGGRVAQRFGLGDVDTMLARGANPQQVASEIAALPAKSIPRQVVEGAISEGFLEELPQSISEQIIQNLALGKPWSEGVEDAAVMGTLAGMAMGGGASLYSGMTRPEPQGSGLPPPTGAEPPAAPPQGFTPTAERPVIDESALGRAGIFPPAPAPIINDRALEPAAPLPSQQMGLDPAAGPMSAAAALAVDTGASATMQQAAQAVDPETGEILETGARVPEQKQATDTPEQMRERLGFIEQQARVNGGWDRRTIEERDRLQAELAKVEPVAIQTPATEQSTAEGAEPAPAIDVSGRTDDQLRVLEQSGRDGWREAAVAEIQRRAAQQPAETPAPAVEPAAQAAVEQQAPADIAQAPAATSPAIELPTQAPTAPEQSRPAPSQRSESAQPSEAIPPATSEGWDGMTAEQRTAILTKPGGWATAKGGLNVIGKKLAGQNWTKINPATRATIERLMQGAPDVQSAQVDAASGQGSGAVPAGSAGVAPGRPVDLGRVDRPAGAPAPGSRARVPVGTAGAQQPAGVEGATDTAAPVAQPTASQGVQPTNVPPTEQMAPQAQEARGQEGEGAQTQGRAAVTPTAARFDSQSGTTRTQAERDLWEKGADSERTESDVGVTAGTQVRFVPLADAVATVREAEQAGVAMTPFQVHQATGIRVGDAERVIREAQAPADAAQPDERATTQPSTTEFTTLKDRDGKTVTVRTADLSSARERMPTFTKEGKRRTAWIHRDNLDPTGEKQAEGAKEMAGNPLFNVITTKDGGAFAIKAAAQRELNARGLAETHEVVPAGDVQAGMKGYLVRKKAEVPAATHKDSGQPAEPVTQPVIAEAIQKSARNTDFNPAEAKAWILGEIDKAIAVAPTADRIFDGVKIADKPATYAGVKTWSVDGPKDADGLTPSLNIEQAAGGGFAVVWGKNPDQAVRAPNLELAKEDAARIVKTGKFVVKGKTGNWQFDATVLDAKDFVSFDVPGDGKFKVVNTVEKLRDFRAKVEKSPGFAKNPDRPMNYGSGMAGAVNLDAEIKRIEGLSAVDRRYQGGDVLEEIGNAIEIARLKKSKDEGKLLDRFKEASKGKDYDAWRAEQEAAEETAAREASAHQRAGQGDPQAFAQMMAMYDQPEDAAQQPEQPAKRYAGPSDVSSRDGQMELANRGGTIATLKAMNAQLRAIAPEEAWADANIEDAADLDALRDQISVALVRANRAGSAEQDSPLRKRLEGASGAELRAVFDALGLAGGARMIQADRVKALMSEDAQAVSDALDDVQSDGEPAAAEAPAQPPAANQPALTGPRRNPAQVSAFTPYAAGDIVAIDGQDWQVQQDMGGWYLTSTGNWRGMHPTIQKIRGMNELIAEIEQAATARPGVSEKDEGLREARKNEVEAARFYALPIGLRFGANLRDAILSNSSSRAIGEFSIKGGKSATEATKKKAQELADKTGIPVAVASIMDASGIPVKGVLIQVPFADAARNDFDNRYVLQSIDATGDVFYPSVATSQPEAAEQADAPADAEAESPADDLLTPDQARALMTWEDLGQRDNVKSMRLAFFESAERMAAKRGAMNYGTIESYQGGKWNIDGTTYPTLKAAKAAAEEAALVRLANDGYVAQPFAAYDAVARTYGYEVRADGAIGSEGKFPGPTIKEKGGRLRVESSKGDLLGTYPATPESLGRFLESFWGAEKQVAQPAAEQPASDRDQFTVERVDEDRRQTLTFKRGETVKVSGKYPMETGQIDGISNARQEFKVGGAWLPFGYAYKAEYDEFAAPRRELEEMIANAEKRIADGTGFQRDGYPIRDAREHAKRYGLEGYDDTLNDLAKRGQAVFDRGVAEDRARMAAAEQTDRERREAADAADAAKYAGPVKMTMGEWKGIHRDFKSFNGGDRTVMQDGRIRRVEIVKEKAEATAGRAMRAVDDGARQPGDSDADVAFSATPPRDRNAVRIGITEKGLVRAMRVQFDGLAEITGKLLERGRAGKRGGVIVIGTADNAEIGRIVAERTGRKLDSTMRKFSSAGRINGFYDPKSGLTFLVGPNLNPVTATAVMLHEMMHGQQRQKIDARALEMVRNRHGRKDEDLRAFLDRVMLRMIAAGEVGNAAEASAYIVEQAVIEGRSAGYAFADNAFMQWVDAKIGKRVGDFLRSFAGMIRTWMLRNGLGARTMTVDDFVGYAMAGLDRAVAGEVRGRANAQASIGARAPQSEAFRRWFGDSKVVDENGQPLVVYHGTGADISAFDPARIGATTDDGDFGAGFYFTTDQGVASSYAGEQPGSNVVPVLLSLQNPLVVESMTEIDVPGFWGAREAGDNQRAAQAIQAAGYDGVIETGGAYPQYVAFRPEQIKSAVGNNGDFDPDNDNILFSRSVGDAPAQEAQRVQSAIEGKTLIEAAQFLTHSNDGAKAAVAQKVLEKLQRLEKAGVVLDLKIVHRGDMAPASMVNARGYTETGFDDKGRDIVVWLNGADVTGKVGTEEEVLLHELVHAATAGMVFYGTQTPNSMAGKHARDLMAVTDAIAEHIRKRFDAADAGKAMLTAFEQDMREGANNAFRSDDEVLAWALSSGEAQAYLETIPYRAGSMWSNFVQAVRNLLGLSARNDTALSEVLRVAERILTDDAPNAGRAAFWHKRNIRMAQQQARGSIVQTAERGADDLQFSRASLENAQQAARNIGAGLKAITVQDVKKAGKHTLTDWLKLGLQFLGRRQLVDVYGDVLPLTEYDRLAAQMEADKNDVGASADDLARRWGRLADESKLADLMHDATLAQIDADSDVEYVPGDDLAKSRALKAQFDQLLPETQKVYRDARDHYRKHHAEVRQAIIDRIMRSELREERRAELLQRMDADFFKAIKGVYFPLSRFGQYVVVTKDGAGNVASVSRAETMAEAETMRAEMVKAFPARDGYQVGRVILSKEFVAGRDMVGRGFMTELYEALDEQGLDPSVQAELEDTLGQLYLSSLPDLSWAKHGIHRKGTAGFSNDARRAFAQNTFHGARYLAKLKYGDQMQAELDRMQKHVDEMAPIEGFDQPAAQRVVDEMNKRHEATMNPKGNPLSTALTSFGFVYYLGISPAAAVVNLSQTPLVAYPVMGAKWGFRKAGAALMAASAEVVEGKNDLRAVLAARLKNEQDPKALRKHQDEIAAYDEAVRTGVIDVTMAHDLAGIAQGEDAKVMWKIRPVMRLASYLFHHAERFNRQATFLAAYRLARDAGAKHDTAYSQAVKATYDGHFDYSTGNRPRVMQGNVAKVVLLFKQYAQNMIYTIARNAYQSVKGESPEVRREARKVFGALMTTHAAAAGVLGLPMVGTLLALASALGGSDDEPWDAEVALRNMLADAFGPKASEVIAKGFSRLTPWDISGRVGLDKLLLPDVNESLEGQRWAESFATAMLGPVIGMGVNAAKGAQKMADGDYGRGLEDMLPIFARNPIKAYRQYSEGEVDRTGVVIKDEVSLAGVLGQASGFSPSEIRLAFEGRSAVMSADRRLAERRQDLMTQFARAAMDQDQDGMTEARTAIADFNKVNPGRRITPPQMWQSVRNRERRIREAEDGVYLPRTRRDVLDEGRFAGAT